MIKTIRRIIFLCKADEVIVRREYEIEVIPTEKTVEKMLISHADDKVLELDYTKTKTFGRILGTILFIALALQCWAFVLLLGMESSDFFGSLLTYTAITGLISLTLYILIHCLYRPIRKIRFHRVAGTVDIPVPWFKGWKGATITIPFEELLLLPDGVGTKMLVISYSYLGHPFFNVPLTGVKERDNLSLIVWFMDKNRPLPPVSIFDAYREVDYTRREAEGFRKPLFKTVSGLKLPKEKRQQEK